MKNLSIHHIGGVAVNMGGDPIAPERKIQNSHYRDRGRKGKSR